MYVALIGESVKGKRTITFDSGLELSFYKKEIASFHLEEGMELSDEVFHELYYEIIGKRVKKRALFLLEKMDRTESQLREKLVANQYPNELIEAAVSYVKEYHYIDDLRFAQNYIQYRQNIKSAMRLKLELLQKGVSKTVIGQALEDTYKTDEVQIIKQFLVKKHYYEVESDPNQKRKIYQALLRKGFKNDDIIHAMKCEDYLT